MHYGDSAAETKGLLNCSNSQLPASLSADLMQLALPSGRALVAFCIEQSAQCLLRHFAAQREKLAKIMFQLLHHLTLTYSESRLV